MSIILWIIFGAIAGWIASMIMGTNADQGALGNIVVGILGALLGGFLFNLFGASGVSDFDIYSLLVAVIGASVLLWIVRAMRHTV